MKKSAINFTHVFNDDKFIDSAIALFESVSPNQSEYYVLSHTSNFTYVKSKKVTAVSIKSKEDARNFVDTLPAESAVMLHALCSIKQLIVLELKPTVISVWFIWGYDLYGQWPLYKRNLYSTKTSAFIKKDKKWRNFKDQVKFNRISKTVFRNKSKVGNVIYNIVAGWYESQFYLAAKEISIIAPIVPTEYKYVVEMGLNPIPAPFNYSCIEWLSSGVNLCEEADDLLVGNSADPSNNHIDIFEIISKLPLENRKVYVPLSYGGNIDYIDFVLKRGRELLGDNFQPLMNFMPLKDYNDIVRNCGFVFLYHRRQQALGNILSSLQMGAKVFMNAKSPILKYFLSLGFDVNISDLCLEKDLVALGPGQRSNNKKLLTDYYSLQAVQAKIKELINIIQQKYKSD